MAFRPPLTRWLTQPSSLLKTKISPPSTLRFPMRRPFSNYRSQIQMRTFPKNKRFNSSGPGPGSSSGSSSSSTSGSSTQKEAGSLSQRLRKLSREYGWAALGVYLALSALDFPICFAAVRLLGAERIGHFEHMVVQRLKDTFPSVWPVKETDGEEEDALSQRNLEEASLWTQLALAYAIHKSVFIFVRVPLTAAVTPKVVKVLRGWGWNIGKRKPKAP